MEITAPSFTIGKTLAQLRLPNRFGISIIAIKKGPDDINIAPSADDSLMEGDILVVVGQNKQLRRLEDH
jgi:trk system potassium uptake protein TrkA